MKFIKRLTLICIFLFVLGCGLLTFCQQNVAFAFNGDIYKKFEDILSLDNGDEVYQQVYLGGYPLGITLDGEGVTVVGLNEFVSCNGQIVCPALESGLQIGDVIVSLDGEKIHNSLFRAFSRDVKTVKYCACL
jgi:hypothetical protein